MSFMVSPFWASVASLDVVFTVSDFLMPTTVTNVDYTSAELTGVTPDNVMVMWTNHTPANDATETTYGHIGFGFVKSGGQFAAMAGGRDAWGADSGVVFQDTSRTIYSFKTNDTAIEKAANGTLISGGINLNFVTNAVATERRASFLAFSGADLDSYCVSHDLGTVTTAQTVTPGFATNAVIAFGLCRNNAGTASAGTGLYRITFGVATADGTQRCLIGNYGGRSPLHSILTNRIGAQLNTTPTTDYHLTVSNFTGTTFDITSSASAAGDDIALVALGGQDAKIVDFTTPTSTGNFSITGVGFTPTCAILVCSALEVVDNFATTDDTQNGFGIAFITATEQSASCHRMDSGTASTEWKGLLLPDVALLTPNDSSCQAVKATFVSFDSDGMTLNFSAVVGTGKKGFVLFLR